MINLSPATEAPEMGNSFSATISSQMKLPSLIFKESILPLGAFKLEKNHKASSLPPKNL